MSILDTVEIWIASLQTSFAAAGIETRFERSPPNRPNPFCSVNLRRENVEADLLVWESGHADLSLGEVPAGVKQEHFEDVRNDLALAEVLSRLTMHVLASAIKR